MVKLVAKKSVKKNPPNGKGTKKSDRTFCLRLPREIEDRLTLLRENLLSESPISSPRVTMTDAVLTAIDRGLEELGFATKKAS